MRHQNIIVIPTYNERENIELLIKEILAAGRFDVLVVDDNSPDGTGRLADLISRRHPQVQVIHRPARLGLGTAYLAGFRRALDQGYELILEMDADFSHHPRYLADLLQAAKRADFVIGSRYVSGVNVVNWPLRRLILSYLANLYARLVTGLKIKDCTSGFKCFHRRVLGSIPLQRVKSDGYAFQIEVSYLAQRQGFRSLEVPIIFEDRRAGHSKLTGGIIWEAAWMVWKLRFESF